MEILSRNEKLPESFSPEEIITTIGILESRCRGVLDLSDKDFLTKKMRLEQYTTHFHTARVFRMIKLKILFTVPKIDLESGVNASLLRKRKKQNVCDERKDEKYWERRRKNNMAAKRSRDARRAKETQIAIQASILERENKNLTQELSKARAENLLLRERLQKYEPM